MKSLGRTRAIAYGAMALFAFASVVFTRPLPRRSRLPALSMQAKQAVAVPVRERFDTLGSRETLVHVLMRSGLSSAGAREALNASSLLDMRRIRVGTPVETRSGLNASAPTEIRIGLVINPTDRYLRLRKTPGGWIGEEERLAWTKDTVAFSGVINSHLTAAVIEATRDELAVRQQNELTWALADLYEFRVDMSRDLRVGDSFTVISEREHGPEGAVRMGKIIAATMTLQGRRTDAIPFQSATARGEYFDSTGRPLRCCFLRAPLAFRRISSGFGMRRHPVLGTMRRHSGTDYAASAGTPVRAIGDGVVIRARWDNGYGNMIELRHPNGYVTRYGHMIGFARGIRAGSRVSVQQTIGYVGSTGLSTGPHLHFEVLVNGTQRDPRRAFGAQSTQPIPAAEKDAFARAREGALELLRGAESPAGADTSSARRATQQ